jgi:hypothetical protein
MERPICLFRLDSPVPCLFTAGFPYFTWGLSLLGISVLVGKHGTAMTIIYEQGDRNGVPRYTVHEFEKKQEAYQVPWAPQCMASICFQTSNGKSWDNVEVSKFRKENGFADHAWPLGQPADARGWTGQPWRMQDSPMNGSCFHRQIYRKWVE